jgi:HSP20 family protein
VFFNNQKGGTIMKALMRNNGNLFPAIPSLLNDFFTDDWFDSSLANWKSTGATLPAVNVIETNDDFRIEVAAPGMKRDDFKVELDNGVLTISSERENKREEKDDSGGYKRREFSYQSFQRSFTLPENKVDGDKIAARYVDGILQVTVPKKEGAKVKPAKQIEVL